MMSEQYFSPEDSAMMEAQERYARRMSDSAIPIDQVSDRNPSPLQAAAEATDHAIMDPGTWDAGQVAGAAVLAWLEAQIGCDTCGGSGQVWAMSTMSTPGKVVVCRDCRLVKIGGIQIRVKWEFWFDDGAPPVMALLPAVEVEE